MFFSLSSTTHPYKFSPILRIPFIKLCKLADALGTIRGKIWAPENQSGVSCFLHMQNFYHFVNVRGFSFTSRDIQPAQIGSEAVSGVKRPGRCVDPPPPPAFQCRGSDWAGIHLCSSCVAHVTSYTEPWRELWSEGKLATTPFCLCINFIVVITCKHIDDFIARRTGYITLPLTVFWKFEPLQARNTAETVNVVLTV